MQKNNLGILRLTYMVLLGYILYLPECTFASLSQKTCSLPTDSFGCPHGVKREVFHYDWSKKACATFNYKGCGGNANRFDTKNECETKCGVYGNGEKTRSLGRKG